MKNSLKAYMKKERRRAKLPPSLYVACIWCGKPLPERGSTAMYCSKKCYMEVNGKLPDTKEIKERLEYLRGEIRAERISYGEIAELVSLANYIQAGDVELAEWAGIDEMEFRKRK